MTPITREDLIVLLGREAFYPTPMDDPGSLGLHVDGLLLDLLQDVSLAADTAPGGGWVPIHAATLLGRRQVTAAIAPLLLQVRDGDADSTHYIAAVQALCVMGPEVLEPTLADWHLPSAPFSDYAYIAAHCGAQDGRVLPRLLAGLACPGETEYYANLLGAYGDRRAVAHLTAHFDVVADTQTQPAVCLPTLRELREAIELLDGNLRVDQALRMARLEGEATRAAADAEPQQRPRRKLGRNDLCWCGSSKKYKKCHAGQDARQLFG